MTFEMVSVPDQPRTCGGQSVVRQLVSRQQKVAVVAARQTLLLLLLFLCECMCG